ncbi:hypothetical protein JQ031_09330 [Clostridium botulinum]|nr:hypothetical protein [Clostridium botulinum]
MMLKLNLRDGEELSTSLERLKLYKNMNTVKIDTTNRSFSKLLFYAINTIFLNRKIDDYMEFLKQFLQIKKIITFYMY